MPNKEIRHVWSNSTKDILFDCRWSEENEFHVLSASGDGCLFLWDVRNSRLDPIRIWMEHTAEVVSVDWNVIKKELFASISWDNSLKIWTSHRPTSLFTWKEHTGCGYSVRWSPRDGNTLATVGGDSFLKFWDIRQSRSITTIKAHMKEVLACDWNKYNQNILATGSIDNLINIWDIRNSVRPLRSLYGHKYGIRNLKWSPHFESILASTSYDMSVVIWNTKSPDLYGNSSANNNPQSMMRYEHHTEFSSGISFNQFIRNQIASCGLDGKIFIWESPNFSL